MHSHTASTFLFFLFFPTNQLLTVPYFVQLMLLQKTEEQEFQKKNEISQKFALLSVGFLFSYENRQEKRPAGNLQGPCSQF